MSVYVTAEFIARNLTLRSVDTFATADMHRPKRCKGMLTSMTLLNS